MDKKYISICFLLSINLLFSLYLIGSIDKIDKQMMNVIPEEQWENPTDKQLNELVELSKIHRNLIQFLFINGVLGIVILYTLIKT